MRHTPNHGRALSWVVFWGILLFSALTADASSDELSLKGTVTSGKEKPLPKVTVKATQLDQQVQKQVLTDSNGNFVFKDLPPGRYRLEAQQTNFETVVKEITLRQEYRSG